MNDEAQSPEETKAEAFIRIGNYRLGKVFDSMDSLKSLATRNYDYDEDQVQKISDALHNKVDEIIRKLDGEGGGGVL